MMKMKMACTDGCSRLLQGGGLGLLLLEEEASGLDAATGSSGLRLGVLGLLDDVLLPSMEDSNLGVIRYGDCMGHRTGCGGG
jgi:hypothetical protein